MRPINLEELRRKQEKMAKLINLKDVLSLDEIKYIAGVDQSFLGFRSNTVISAGVLLTFPELEVVDEAVTVDEVNFPYIPTFLMFREGHSALNALKKIVKGSIRDRTVIMVDGSGIAHPRKCGLASYIGLEMGMPSIGVTKKKLIGEFINPSRPGESKPLMDGKELIGYVLKSCNRCKPIFISPGCFISHDLTVKIVKMTLKGYKLPEPLRIAHRLAGERRKDLLKRESLY